MWSDICEIQINMKIIFLFVQIFYDIVAHDPLEHFLIEGKELMQASDYWRFL